MLRARGSRYFPPALPAPPEPPAVDDGIGLDEIAAQQVLRGEERFVESLLGRGKNFVGARTVLPMHGHGVEAHRAVGVGFEEVDLLLEFERVGPIVVGFAEGDVGRVDALEHVHRVFPRADVGVAQERLDDAGVAGGVVADDFGGSVGRGVVGDESHEGEVRFLREEAVEHLRDELFLIVGNAGDGEFCIHCFILSQRHKGCQECHVRQARKSIL